MTTKTIFDAYSDFEAADTKGNKLIVRSVMHRFLAESWGGQAPQASKATNKEVFKFLELIKSLPSTSLVGSMETLEQKFVEKDITKENSKSYKSAYKAFINWAESNNYFLEPKKDIELKVAVKLFNRNPNGNGLKTKVNHGQKSKDAYTLMATFSRKDKSCGQLIYESDYINNNLALELELFKKFRKEEHRCSNATIQKDIKLTFRILGWLHRYKNITLQDLSLTSIITYIELNVSIKRFRNKLGIVDYQSFTSEKALVRQNAVEIANENKNLIKEYIDFVGGHPNSKVICLSAIIAIAKFIFRNEIGTDEYIDETDLAIVRRLNQLSNNFSKIAKDTPASVPHEKKTIPWTEVIDVLQILKLRADCTITEGVSTRKTKSGEIRTYTTKKQRKANTIANDLQDFLAVAFMVLIPTDRARTYYELEIGRTFVYGLYNGVMFKSADNLKDKTQAKWYIHLKPADYKTGKKYKEYWGVMPNVDFGDGSKLYDYIDKWLNKERECEQKCNHNFFFRKSIKYIPFGAASWGQYIKNRFEAQTGVPVTPKEIRKMYITYLYNSKKDDATLKSAAYAMHHSQAMQQNTYNSQTILERLESVYEYNEQMHKEFFGENSPHED